MTGSRHATLPTRRPAGPVPVGAALRSPSQPLDRAVRQRLEPWFGRDLSTVRVHTDEQAAESARAVGAAAYTVGTDMIFGRGQFDPGSAAGRQLLAHELTHVVQQDGHPVSGQVEVGPAEGELEQEAAAQASRVADAPARRRPASGRRSAGRAMLQRSLLGGAPKTIGNTIHLRSDWGHFIGDSMQLTQGGQETLIHEMGHVWQYQNGGLAYIPESLWAQFKGFIGAGSRGAAYDWREADRAGLPWEKWNPEQQAAAIEDYNIKLRKSKDGTATLGDLSELSTLLPYLRNVWARQGAPHFETLDLKVTVPL
jgi:hypothetical protein